MKNKFLYLATAMLISLTACKKLGTDIDKSATAPAKPMLKTITWPSLGMYGNLEYNSDSTVKSINYTGTATPYQMLYSYGANGITKAEPTSSSLSVALFSYNIAGRLISMNKSVKEVAGYREYARTEFAYDASGKLTTLYYYLVNALGKTLTSTSTYEYDGSSLPVKITTVDKNNNKTVIAIDHYSDDVLFDPTYLFDREMGWLNSIYNYALLNQLSIQQKLPSQISVSDYSSAQPRLIKQVKIDFTITGKKLYKQISTTIDPTSAAPTILETHYSY